MEINEAKVCYSLWTDGTKDVFPFVCTMYVPMQFTLNCINIHFFGNSTYYGY